MCKDYFFSFVTNLQSIKKNKRLTSDLLEDLLHAAASLVTLRLLGIHCRGRQQSSSGKVGAAASASEAPQAAAAAAARGRGSGPPPGTSRRPVGFHDRILGLKPGIISAPRLSWWWGRGANHSPETQVLVLDVFHLYPLAGVDPVRQPGRRALLRSDSGWTHGPVLLGSYPSICRRSVT